MVAFAIVAVCMLISPFFSLDYGESDILGDFAVAVRDTRMFASMEPYAEILGKVDAGQFYPVRTVLEDPYGIRWAEVDLSEGRTGFLSDIIVVRDSEDSLKRLLRRVDLTDIGLWDDEILQSVQKRGVEVGFSVTQLLFAQGLPLKEQKRTGFEEWFYSRLVVLIKDDTVIGYTEIENLAKDRNIVIHLEADDPEFLPVSGQWQRVESYNSTYLLAASGQEVGRLEISVAVKGKYRFSAKWSASSEYSAQVRYAISQGREQLGVLKANQRLYSQQWVRLGEFDLEANNILMVEITAADGKPFVVDALRIEYVNKPVLLDRTAETDDRKEPPPL